MDDIKEKIKQALRHIWINKYRLFFCLLTLCFYDWFFYSQE